MVTRRFMWGTILAIVLTAVAVKAQIQSIVLESLVSNLSNPVFLTNAHDGTNRKFILEQAGRILVMQPGDSTPSVFLDISNRVLSGGEQGLLGLAFHPQFASNQRFFVNYTRRPDGATVVAEYHVSRLNSNQADPASELEILVVAQPFANHNGGMIEFGPDRFLYVGMGDGGSGNDPQNRAQNADDLLGKMLRIDIDHPANASIRYSSPATNPFAGSRPGRDEIFAVGLRNPWRFSFDRFDGRLYVGDVGQNAVEEIDIVTAGGNYGWRLLEGSRCTNLDPASCARTDLIRPIAEYTHEQNRCSVIGGYVYRGSRLSLPHGAYVFGDLCSGEVFMLHNGLQTVLLDTNEQISSFGEDEDGEIFLVGLGGSIYRITGTPSSQIQFSAPSRGGAFVPLSRPGALITGYARIQSDPGNSLPDGLAIFQNSQGNILISEASIAAAPLIRSGRISASISASTSTGIVFANPNSTPATLDFYFTDSSGQNFGLRTTTIPAGGQIASFLNDAPFLGLAMTNGTFTFSSSEFIAAMAISGLSNQHSEFSFSTLPIAPVIADWQAPSIFPHWAQGDGWETDFELVNPSDQSISGEIHLLNSGGQLLDIRNYAIKPRAAQRISFPYAGPLRAGYAQVISLDGTRPIGIAIFRLSTAAGVVTETGVPAIEGGTAFRGYGEFSAEVNMGLAVANVSPSPTSVEIELTSFDGTEPTQRGSMTLSPLEQRTLFVNEIPGASARNAPFRGVIRLTSSTPIAVSFLRCRLNQRGDFLISAGVPVDESAAIPYTELYIPQLAVGNGYNMQFIFLNSIQSSSQTGIMRVFAPDGRPLQLGD